MKAPSEDQARLIEHLKSLGLTKYEALVYIALLQVTSATASEIHESSGVPRASVYPVLDQLLDKDLVSVSQSVPKRFAAIPPNDAITRLLARIEQDAKSALGSLIAINQKRMGALQGSEELIWNISGIASIRKRLIELINAAQTDIRIIAHSGMITPEIRNALIRKSDRVSVDIITPLWEGPVPATIQLHIKKHFGIPSDQERVKDVMAGGICIVDRCRVLVIVGSGEEDAAALLSESEGFVRFFVRYYSLITDWIKTED